MSFDLCSDYTFERMIEQPKHLALGHLIFCCFTAIIAHQGVCATNAIPPLAVAETLSVIHFITASIAIMNQITRLQFVQLERR